MVSEDEHVCDSCGSEHGVRTASRVSVKCPHSPLPPAAAAAAARHPHTSGSSNRQPQQNALPAAAAAAVIADSSNTVSRRRQSAAAAQALLPMVPNPWPVEVALGVAVTVRLAA
uniref:Uncharacterized protein n=1 Tax=Oryza barthii TaxID=65489 RepID=A0A0D3GYF4_9ORYZ